MTKSTAVAKDLEKNLAEFQAKAAANAAAADAGSDSIQIISTKHGRLTIGEREVPGGVLPAVVLNATVERSYYDSAYNSDKIVPPVCFALGEEPNALKPHENVPEPVNDKCKGCPKAEFGTAAQGRGPACKTRMRLVLMPQSAVDAPELIPEADLAMIKISPTSVKNWTKYAMALTAKLPLFGAITDVKNAPSDKYMIEQSFTMNADSPIISKEMMGPIIDRLEEAEEHAMRPWRYEDE